MSRYEVSRLLNDYVKRRGLTDKKDARFIIPDDRLRGLFADVPPRPDDIYDDPRIRVFDMHRRLIAHHFFAWRVKNSIKKKFEATLHEDEKGGSS